VPPDIALDAHSTPMVACLLYLTYPLWVGCGLVFPEEDHASADRQSAAGYISGGSHRAAAVRGYGPGAARLLRAKADAGAARVRSRKLPRTRLLPDTRSIPLFPVCPTGNREYHSLLGAAAIRVTPASSEF
jgi:hypothetical protein